MTSRSLLAAAVLCCAVPAPALAQLGEPVKPYVLLLFDTSGSMNWRVCDNTGVSGNNTAECPGNDVACSACSAVGCGDGIPNDTRLYKVKKGMTSVVGAFGEVIFGLSRFHQEPRTFGCTYDRGYGGWRGAGTCTSTPLGTDYNRADILVPFADGNQNQILEWMNNCDDYPNVGDCPWGVRPGTGGHPATPTTGCSLCAECGTGCDKELRAAGNTPLAGSLYHFRTAFFPGVLATDAKSECRPYKVIMLTDGANNCLGDPEAEARALYEWSEKSIAVHVIGFASDSLTTNLNRIAAAGGTTAAVMVDDETALALAMANIVSESLLVEKCNGIDDDCNGLCDENFPEVAVTNPECDNFGRPAMTCTVGVGICQRTGSYVCSADGESAVCSVTPGPPDPGGEICGNGLDDNCDGQIDEGCDPCIPQPEVCDGKDNNCNGLIDEDYTPVPCGSDIGACASGMTACVNGQVVCNGAVPPTTELCDNIDNNCDGIVDSFTETCYPENTPGCDLDTGICLGVCRLGARLCTNGSWGQCLGYVGPSEEICNGLDDDCDGEIDEGVSNTCIDYADCSTYTSCEACPAKPDEVCDGKDNDCNGLIDDNPIDAGGTCGSGVGECKRGTWVCENGQLVCKGETPPSPEICDGKDNDCNGLIDDNVPGEGEPCGTDVGECEPGVTKCVGGKWVCVGGVQPRPEICDGKDNDCDGEIDEFAECPGESACVEGRCVLPCASQEFACPGGMTCVGGYCIPDACVGIECAPHERCAAGQCVDRCAGVSCKDHEACDPDSGQCRDDSCVSKGCPVGQACIDYACVETGCKPDTCPADQQCFEGECYPSCLSKDCPAGQVCALGSCAADPCAAAGCPQNHVCELHDGTARCVPDPCRLISCPPGKTCVDAACVADPCAVTLCPKGQRCVLVLGDRPTCEADPNALQGTTRRMLAVGAGGLSCAVEAAAGSRSPPWSLLLVLALGLGVRRLVRRPRGVRR